MYNNSIAGMTAEYIVQAKLSHMLNISVRMPENSIYDLLNAKNKCSIEVKSSTQTGKRAGHQFSITQAQLEKNACDYFVCIAFHNSENPFDFTSYIVPHEAMVNIISLRKSKTGYVHVGIGVKSRRCTPDIITLGKDKWDLLVIDNKSSFTYHKNKLAKSMINKFNDFYLVGEKDIEYTPIDKLSGMDKEKGRRYRCLKCPTQKRKSLGSMKLHILRTNRVVDYDLS